MRSTPASVAIGVSCRLAGLALASAFAGCGAPVTPSDSDAQVLLDAGPSDAGASSRDAGLGDAGRGDAGPSDGGSRDAGLDDAGKPFVDAAIGDAGLGDAGWGDAGLGDAGLGDAGAIDAGPEPLPACPVLAAGTLRARTPLIDVRETSGIVESRLTPGLYWLHNDSGDSARIFAVDSTSMVTARATYTFSGVTARDWEDIAVGPGPEAGVPYLYVGDIGDNGESRGSIQVYRVREPATPTATGSFSSVERFELVYPDGPHNAETLMIDPRTGDLYVVVKADSGVSPVFRAAAPLATGSTITLEEVAVLTFGAGSLPGDTTTTGGDISASGAEILIRTYDSAYLWRRVRGASIAEALATEPCRVPLASEGQGEAIGFATDGAGYLSTGEGSLVAISYYARR